MKPRLPSPGPCLLLSVALFSSDRLSAASRIWDGGLAGSGTNWDTAANWNGDTVTATTDDVTFVTGFASGTSISLNGNKTTNSVTINTSSGFSIANNALTLTSGNLTRTAASSGTQTISSTVTLGASGVWNINGSGSLTVSGNIDDGGSSLTLTKNGTGTLILSGINGYDGGTIINGGSVIISGRYSKSTSLTTLNAGTLTLDYSSDANNKLQQQLNLGGGALVMTGGTTNYSETVTATTVAAGASSITRSSGTTVLQQNAITRSVGGTLNYSIGNIANTDNTNTNGILGGWVTVGRTDWAKNSTGIANGSITAYTAYTDTSAGTTAPGTAANVNLLASNTTAWNTQTINSLRFNAASALTLTLASGQTLAVSSGGILVSSNVGANNQSITGGTLAGANGQDLTIHQNGTGVLAIGSVIANNTSATGLTKSGTGKMVLTGTNTYTGQTYLNEGTVGISSNANLGAAATGATLNLDGGTLEATSTFGLYNGSAGTNNRSVTLAQNGGTIAVTGANNLTIAGTVSGVGSLNKTDTGTLTLSGANTYTGGTTITAGKLLVNSAGGTGTGTGAVAVASGGTLGGTGTISGATSVQSGGVHAAGSGTGVQTFSNNLTYQDGSIFSWEIDRNQTQARGAGYDAVNVGGTLAGLDGADAGTTLDAVFRVVIGDSDFSSSFWDANRSWSDIFTTNGTIAISNWATLFSGGFQYYNTSGSALATPTGQGSFSLSGNTLSWTAVPEPTTALAGVIIGAAILRRRRKY